MKTRTKLHYWLEEKSKDGIIRVKKLYSLYIFGYDRPICDIEIIDNKLSRKSKVTVLDNNGYFVKSQVFDLMTVDKFYTNSGYEILLTDRGIELDDGMGNTYELIPSYRLFSYVEVLSLRNIKTGEPYKTYCHPICPLTLLDKELNNSAYALRNMIPHINYDNCIKPLIRLHKGVVSIKFIYNEDVITLGEIYNNGVTDDSSIMLIDREKISCGGDTLEFDQNLGQIITNKSISLVIEKVTEKIFIAHLTLLSDQKPKEYKIAFRLKDDE